MARLTDIVFDSFDPPMLARFWANALDNYSVRPYSEEDIKLLAEHGLTPDTDTSVAVDGPGPTLFFQKSDQPKDERNRVHLDIRAPDREIEVSRLEQLGARVRDVHDGFTVLLDPEGNEFCVVELPISVGRDDA